MSICLANLAYATAQEVMDQCVQGLLTQGHKSMENGQCKYRSEDGLKCGAGFLIADHEYREYMENRGWAGLAAMGYAPHNHEFMIQHIQVVHDSCKPSAWAGKLKELCKEYNLKYNPPAIIHPNCQTRG